MTTQQVGIPFFPQPLSRTQIRTVVPSQTISHDSSIILPNFFTENPTIITFLLHVDIVSGTTPSLDISIDTKFNDPFVFAGWFNVGRFDAVTAVITRAMQFNINSILNTDYPELVGLLPRSTVAPGSLRGFLDQHLRIRWIVTGTSPSFTFGIQTFERYY